MPKSIRTVCLEFFGQVRDSVPAIVEIKSYLDTLRGDADKERARAPVLLAGLEHMDERYLKAVGYATKASGRKSGTGRPKMVLIGDIVGDDDEAVAQAAVRVVQLAAVRCG